jgi:putative ABC transport system permease protein
MSVLLKISLRNLVRQKRRNILLGIGIAFGMSILIIANAFSHGISDILLNKIVATIAGHIIVDMSEKDEKEWAIIRDKERIKTAVLENVEGVQSVYENVITSGRALGNGNAEFMTLFGVEPDEIFYQETRVVEGNVRDIEDMTLENPIAMFDQMAEDLNVKLNDVVRMRFETVYGQTQTARLTVVAILKADNPFMNVATFVHLNKLKPLLGYETHETQSLSITLKHLANPKTAVEQANHLHEALKAKVAGYTGRLVAHDREVQAEHVAVFPDEDSYQAFTEHLQLVEGHLEKTLQDEHALLLSQQLADELGVVLGDEVTSQYETKFAGFSPSRAYRVSAIFQANNSITAHMVFLHAKQFYETYFSLLPKYPLNILPDNALFPLLLKEWRLLGRSPDSEALRKKYERLEDEKWRGAILDVKTMHEVASEVLKLEQVLDIVTMVAVLILFFIILIGVVNTLRMTIRERTREIGTVRAIGMQRGDVRWSFVLEVLMLTAFACAAGTILAIIGMELLKVKTFHSEESFFMIFLVENHLHFVPTVFDVVKNLAIILGIAFITSFFPTGRAAKMSVVDALRHYE